MKIKQIYIENFKGIKENVVINLNEDVTLLTGPNGFGKTTIFDALELCFTGKINRIVGNIKVETNTKSYKKPPYQNTKGKDIVIKVFFEIDDKYYCLSKVFKHNQAGLRFFASDFSIFQTYLDEILVFNNFKIEKYSYTKKILQEDVDKIFGTSSFPLTESYLLFNYLQQEENIYFLKKSAKDKKDDLRFLFQVGKEHNELDKIDEYSTKLSNILNKLDKEIDIYKEKNDKKNFIENKRIIKNTNIEIDADDIFSNVDLANLDDKKTKCLFILREWEDFLLFDLNEYKKNEEKKRIEKYLDPKYENIINVFILEKYFLDKKIEKINDIKIISSDPNIEQYFFKNYLNKENYLKIKKTHLQYIKYDKFLHDNTGTIFSEKKQKENFINITNDINRELFFNLDAVKKRVGEKNKTIDSLKEFRLDLIKKFEIYKELEIFNKDDDSEKCPLCTYDWNNDENNSLLDKIDKQTTLLDEINFDDKEKLEALKKESLELFTLFKAKAELFLNQNEGIKEFFPRIDNLKKQKDIQTGTDELIVKLEEFLEENNSLNLHKSFNFSINNLKALNIEAKKNKLQVFLKGKIKVDDGLLRLLNNLKENLDYREPHLLKIKEIIGQGYDQYQINSNQIADAFLFSKKKKELIEKLNLIKSSIKINFDKIKKTEFYSEHFNSNELEYLSWKKELDPNLISKKKNYIDYKFFQKKNEVITVLEDRQKKLNEIKKKIDSIRNKYRDELNLHYVKIVNSIKLPFYVYTAKILQNYQQGMGLFIVNKDLENRKGFEIKFSTEGDFEDHDAIYSLSSGQLAVVSLCFTLSMNKTYKVSDKKFEFLAIDDPVQEMDSLNIHSFVELMRHDFLEDYQILMSTHDDSNALFIKYKFDKYKNNSTKILNVQDEFFKSN